MHLSFFVLCPEILLSDTTPWHKHVCSNEILAFTWEAQPDDNPLEALPPIQQYYDNHGSILASSPGTI